MYPAVIRRKFPLALASKTGGGGRGRGEAMKVFFFFSPTVVAGCASDGPTWTVSTDSERGKGLGETEEGLVVLLLSALVDGPER